MSERQDAQDERREQLNDEPQGVVDLAALPTPKQEQAQQDRPVLSVALGNVILTPDGAEVTFVFPKEVVFIEGPDGSGEAQA